jgi:hypothetical protein
VSACEDHAPTLEDLSLVEDAEGYRKQPTTEVGKRWEEERSHTLMGEIHSLVCACLAPVKSWLVSTKVKDDGKHDGEARVILNLKKERRSSFEKFDPRSYSNSAEETIKEGDG